MTEILNGHSDPVLLLPPFQQNGHPLDECPKQPNPQKPPRKKVSFHENVTDIDTQDETTLQENDLPEEDTEDVDKEDEDDDFSLDSILNISEKISFFSTIATKEEKQWGSIPQARLAFVTGMVDGSCETERGHNDIVHPQQPDCPAADDTDMAGVTFMKIFAAHPAGKGKNDAVAAEPVVDTSSILEHREELRELWEKRMMADDNQSSPSSVATEKTKPEEGQEEAVVTTKTIIISESETPAKMTNGGCNGVDHPQVATEPDAKEEDDNSPDSLETSQVEEYVEEKTYTSETSFVMKQQTAVEEAPVEVTVTKEEVVETKTEETVETKVEIVETKIENVETTVEAAAVETKVEEAAAVEEKVETVADVVVVKEVSEDKVENIAQDIVVTESRPEEEVVEKEVVPALVAEVEVAAVAQPEDKKEQEKEIEKVVEATVEVVTKVEETIATAPVDKQPILQIEESKQDGDGFVTLEDCLPKVEDASEIDCALPESVEPQPVLSNGHVEHAEANSLPPTPEPTTAEDKANHPEIVEFVKNGGVKRIIPGVQKTEQPYSTCTTETKIAMEIREMREREEELRIMREQAALSPAPSPLPPAHSPAPSIRSPSPSVIKEQTTPYRVSSVFGRGTPSPSEERQAPFKGVVAKETAVEREIRLARDREEELRKQKGLPPREDDSYVKPSQVKSSQVRVFGKANGANVKQAATAKIQLEIEEQTQREIALRDTGSIQTISHERTDAKVAKLKTPEPPATNGTSHPATNGHLNGRSSPEKRPSAPRPASIFSQGVSMHKFIASKGAPRPAFVVPAPAPKQQEEKVTLKVKKNVESKIQQEIMEMKMREEELKLLHMNANGNGTHNIDSMEHEMNQKNNIMEYENGHDLNEEDISPRHNKLIAQWEQRIQKAES